MDRRIINVIFLFLIIGIAVAVNAQDTKSKAKPASEKSIYLNGDHVFDLFTGDELIGTLTEVLAPNDSSVLVSNKYIGWSNGVHTEGQGFAITIPDRNKNYLIRFSKEGYVPEYRTFTGGKYGKSQKYERWDDVYLERRSKTLDEVNVVASKIKFYHRGDTLVYNADAFVLPEGSMLDGLLEQLPGVKLDESGVITVNGKRVDFLLLDGKEFFSHDRRLMLKNIAHYTIKNVEVYESDDRRFSTGNKNDMKLLMDVKLKKDYSQGFMGNIEGGYGTSERYLGRLFGAYFNRYLSLGIIGNTNNLNDERRPGQQGSWNPGKLSAGERKVSTGALTYNYTAPDKKFTLNGDASVKYTDFTNSTAKYTTSFLPGGDTYLRSFRTQKMNDLSVATYHQFYMSRKALMVKGQVNYSYNKGHDDKRDRSATFSRDMQDITAEDIEKIHNSSASSSASSSDLLRDVVNSRLENTYAATHKSVGSATTSLEYKLDRYATRFYLDLGAGFSAFHDNESEDYSLRFGNSQQPGINFRRDYNNYPNHTYTLDGGLYYERTVQKWVAGVEYSYGYKSVTANSDIYLIEETTNGTDYNNASMRDFMREHDPNT